MAKLDQLDPRWIVEFRPDHNNVGNWHWVEKNATEWSQKKIKELLKKLRVTDEKVGEVYVKEVTEVSGDVTANNRKGKLIFLIDLKIKLTWEGRVSGDPTVYKGELEIPEFDDVNVTDCTIDISVKATTDAGYALKELMRTKGIAEVRVILGDYLTKLREEYSRNLILPTPKDGAKPKGKTSHTHQSGKNGDDVSGKNLAQNNQAKPVKIDCSKLELEEIFRCPAAQLYMALTDESSLKAMCSGDAEVDAQPGGRFALYGGAIQGEFVKLEPFSTIVQRWRLRTWGHDAHYSEVTMRIEESSTSGDTVLKLTQTGIPTKYLDDTKNGWDRNFFDRLKAVHGFAAMVM